jgi:predicted site-specific integrase-resolvase
MKLSDWAKEQGVTYLTAYKWFRAGNIPNAIQYPTGTIIVNELQQYKNNITNCVIYCRVSSHNKKQDLESQIQRCTQFANSNGFVITKVYKEIASGMNDKRKELSKLLDSSPSIIIIENKDRLTRFGFNYLEKLLLKLNCSIIVINTEQSDENDLMKDLISIITSFCCRLYGLRRTKNKLTKIKKVLNEKH